LVDARASFQGPSGNRAFQYSDSANYQSLDISCSREAPEYSPEPPVFEWRVGGDCRASMMTECSADQESWKNNLSAFP
jgi:hypothetical protein